MKKKIRVGAVSYMNSKPLIYGLSQEPMASQIEFSLDYPSNLTTKLQKDELDIALLPVASLSIIRDAQIISDYCISSNNKVASVCLFSHVPIEEIQHIFLDYQSRTSVMLLRILLKDYWHIRPSILEGESNYIEQIKDKTAGLIIGDRALDNLTKFPYMYDLAEAWHDHTKKPFVFATWVANKELKTSFLKDFNVANAIGFNHIPEIIESLDYKAYDLNTYFTQNINYNLDEHKRNGMTMFLKMVEQL